MAPRAPRHKMAPATWRGRLMVPRVLLPRIPSPKTGPFPLRLWLRPRIPSPTPSSSLLPSLTPPIIPPTVLPLNTPPGGRSLPRALLPSLLPLSHRAPLPLLGWEVPPILMNGVSPLTPPRTAVPPIRSRLPVPTPLLPVPTVWNPEVTGPGPGTRDRRPPLSPHLFHILNGVFLIGSRLNTPTKRSFARLKRSLGGKANILKG